MDAIFCSGDFEMGVKLGSCWSEVMLVIIKVKTSNMTSYVTSHFQYKIQYTYSFQYKIRHNQRTYATAGQTM